jgi:predicted PurR-regulated permease PerM
MCGTGISEEGEVAMSPFEEFMRTAFFVYCIYAVYSCLVIFNRPNNPSENDKLKGFRIPVIVLVYFLLPCAALYLLYKAFWQIHSTVFWTGTGSVFVLSFFIMLYFLTDEEWPVGKFLQMHKLPTSIVFVVLSLNLAISVVSIGASLVARHAQTTVLASTASGEKAQQSLDQLRQEESAKQAQVRSIQSQATAAAFTTSGSIVTLLTGIVTFATSMVGLMVALRKGKAQ